MKIIARKRTVIPKKIIEVPDGDFCQRADGTVDCKYLQYDISPFGGAYWHCEQFVCNFNVPYDNKPVCAKRDIKKCDKCKACKKVK